MVVIVRIEVTDDQRRALRARMGRTGKATRDEVRSIVEFCFTQDVEDAVGDFKASIPNVFGGKDTAK